MRGIYLLSDTGKIPADAVFAGFSKSEWLILQGFLHGMAGLINGEHVTGFINIPIVPA